MIEQPGVRPNKEYYATAKVTEQQEMVTKLLDKLVQARTEGKNRGRTSSNRYCVPAQVIPAAPLASDAGYSAPSPVPSVAR